MNIDPRLMSEYIKAQLLNGSLIGQTDNANDSTKIGQNSQNNQFNAVFQLAMMMQNMVDSDGKIIENPIPTKLTENSSQIKNTRGQIGEFPAYLMKASTFEPIVQRAAEQHQVPTALIRAVMQAESGFNPNAVSSAGAKGLMQLMDGTAQGLGVDDSLDPEQNVFGGTKYLSGLLKKYNGNEAIAAAAYNAGPGRVDHLGITDQASLDVNFERLPSETQTYVKRVMENREKWTEREINQKFD